MHFAKGKLCYIAVDFDTGWKRPRKAAHFAHSSSERVVPCRPVTPALGMPMTFMNCAYPLIDASIYGFPGGTSSTRSP